MYCLQPLLFLKSSYYLDLSPTSGDSLEGIDWVFGVCLHRVVHDPPQMRCGLGRPFHLVLASDIAVEGDTGIIIHVAEISLSVILDKYMGLESVDVNIIREALQHLAVLNGKR